MKMDKGKYGLIFSGRELWEKLEMRFIRVWNRLLVESYGKLAWI